MCGWCGAGESLFPGPLDFHASSGLRPLVEDFSLPGRLGEEWNGVGLGFWPLGMGDGGAEGVLGTVGNGGYIDGEASIFSPTDYTGFNVGLPWLAEFPELPESQAAELDVMVSQILNTTDSQSTPPSPTLLSPASSSTRTNSDESNCRSAAPLEEKRKQPSCFKRTSTTKRHKRYHERHFTCPVSNCNERFSLRLDCKRHLETVKHGGERKFHCQWCVKRFTRKDNYNRHLRKQHKEN